MSYRVRCCALRLLLAENVVIRIGCQRVRDRAVGFQLVDIGDKVLVKEELADMRNRTAGQSTVGELGCILMNDHVL